MTFRILWTCLLAAALQAQETRSMIYGRVLDSQSSAVAGAQVIVTNTDTNAPVHLKSNATGYYEASHDIFSTAMIGTGQVTYRAGNHITFGIGFSATAGTNFRAFIHGCGQ